MQLLFENPFEISVAAFLRFFWDECGYILGGKKLPLLDRCDHFFKKKDPFKIGAAAFLGKKKERGGCFLQKRKDSFAMSVATF